MADIKGILDSMLAVAKAAAPLISPAAPQAIELGERVIEMIDHAKQAFEHDMPPELPQQREIIEQRIRADVADTARRLRGEH